MGKVYSRRKLRVRGAFLSWRWRALLGVFVLLLSLIPLNLLPSEQAKVSATACACTVFGTPTGQSNFSGTAIELGVKIIPTSDGTITGVRFYKQGLMSGTHTGRLWTSGGSSITSAVFSGETASGWQEVTFGSPVAVTAGTTYVASVTMADGRYIATANYFTSNIVNGPLTAPSSGSSGGNGVFNATAGSFPSSTFNSTNYWIDVVYYDQTAPQTTALSPVDASTNVLPSETVSATFDQNMDATTFTSSTFTVKDGGGTPVTGTYSYNDTTKTASFVATNGFETGVEYTATLEGGSGTVVKNKVGTALASDVEWSFTIASTNLCPCDLKARAQPIGSGTFDDIGSLELGVKVKATTNGYITAIRFYKPIISTETTHTARIWSSTGTQLTSVSFTNESAYGWQEATLSSPFQVAENQVYIISYGTTTAVYQATAGGHNTNMGGGYLVAHADNSSENAATGSGNRNGVFITTAGSYPNSGSTNGTYYWIDAVFSTEQSPETSLDVGVVQPTNGSYGVPRNQVVTATFNRGLDDATVTNSTFRLFDSSNNQVSGTADYDIGKAEAIFTPTSQLTYGQQYTARLSPTVADRNGTTLGTEYSWSFTVGEQLASDPTQGPGGPVLVVTSTTNKYSTYYAEILRAEGFNYFDVKDIATVNATTLNGYDAVVLAQMTLSQSQADMFDTWVNAGGNLVAMRPDTKLTNLLGLTSAGTTRTNQYLLVNTATVPGDGIVSETMQFKGVADNYSLNGATSVATLYSDASTATTNPAVTTRSVGTNGGTAAAFTYDLAKSVIAQHQGNQSWAGQNRDGVAPIRSNDLFFGAMTGDVQPDWTDPNKFHIPQADEQQRLLANILTESTRDKRPLPRFWYLPGDLEAAVVMAGDDHDLSNAQGTERVMSNWLNESVANCSAMDWECIRASHYVYPGSSLTNARAVQYQDLDFEIADHVGNTCNSFSSFASLSSEYTSSLATWAAKYTGVSAPVTNRYHCYVWADWDSQMRVEALNNIRYDLNYVVYPSSWVAGKTPLMTGSGMNMRFTDADGDMIDVRQGVTNFDNTTTAAPAIGALLDNAIGAPGYYGVFGTHYDMSGDSYDATLLAAVRAKGVPMISSKQALTWFDGRDSSSFTDVSGEDGLFTFGISAAEGANDLKAMLPIQDAGGTLSSLKIGSSSVTYDTRTIKGVQYAVFGAAPGSYTAQYTDYVPDNGNGGGDNGGSSGGTDDSTSSGGSPTPTKKKTTALNDDQTTAEEVPQITTTEEQPQNRPKQTTKEPVAASTDEDNSWSWVLWTLGGFMTVGFIWWGVSIIRRPPG